MATVTFSSKIADWVRRVEGGAEAVFKESAQEVVSQAQAMVPVATGFLRNSLLASTTAMPPINPAATGDGAGLGAWDDVALVIAGAELGDTLFFGWTAAYSGYVHWGARGQPPRPWVSMAAQRWPGIVADKTAELQKRLGL